MRLSTGWSSHFSAFGGSDAANANMAIFSNAMKTNKSKMEKIKDLVKDEDTIALVTGKDGKIKSFHGFKKFGGTCTCPELKIGCLIGSGVQSNPIIDNLNQITKAKESTVPSMNAIWECTTIKELQNLENLVIAPTATATTKVTCTGGQRQTAASRAEGEITPLNPIETITFSKAMCFIPAPFIVEDFFQGVPNDPLELNLSIKQAAIDFNNKHSTNDKFENVNATIQAKCFAVWAYTVSKGYIEETSFKI
jgi:hypothetical protein